MSGWPGREAGLDHPQRIVRIAGAAVETSGQYADVLGRHAIGDRVSVFTLLPDGTPRLYPSVELTEFTRPGLVRFFLLPYGIGLAYLLIGMWVYRVTGASRPGRVLSFFCFSTSLVCMLLFDLNSTHMAAEVWASALALCAGAILSLAMRFPQTWHPVRRRPWLLAGVFTVTITVSQKTFVALTGERSDAAIVLATLIVVSVVTPIRGRLQSVIDREVMGSVTASGPLRRFGDQLGFFNAAMQGDELAQQFLETAVASSGAAAGALTVRSERGWTTTHTVGRWRGQACLAVPLAAGGRREAVLSLGPRQDGRRYTHQQADELLALGAEVARAMRLARTLTDLANANGHTGASESRQLP